MAGPARSPYLAFLGLLLAVTARLPGYLPPLMAPAAARRQEAEGRPPGGRRRGGRPPGGKEVIGKRR